jgi:hypothetical protein
MQKKPRVIDAQFVVVEDGSEFVQWQRGYRSATFQGLRTIGWLLAGLGGLGLLGALLQSPIWAKLFN